MYKPPRSKPGWIDSSLVPLLPHDGHRLRQRRASHGARLREGDRGRHRPLPAPPRPHDPLRHRQRRALAERLQAGPGARPRSPGLLRPDGNRCSDRRTGASRSRTTTSSARPSPRHRVAVQTLVRRIAEAGDIFEGDYEGWYCVSCEAFKQERDLVDGKCAIHKTTPEWIKERNHFFRLSKYREPLLPHLEANPRFVEPAIRRNEILRLARGRPRRSVDQPRRAGMGYSDADRSRQGDLRLVRRADQLHLGRGLRRRPGDVRALVAGRPPCRSARTSRASTASSGRRC